VRLYPGMFPPRCCSGSLRSRADTEKRAGQCQEHQTRDDECRQGASSATFRKGVVAQWAALTIALEGRAPLRGKVCSVFLRRCGTGGKEIGRISGDRTVQGSGLGKIRHEFGKAARVHDRIGKLVRADFTGLFEQVDAFRRKLGLRARFVVLPDQPRQVQRAGQPRRFRAYDQHVGSQRFSAVRREAISD